MDLAEQAHLLRQRLAMDPDHWDPQACSVLGDVLDEPAYGTASVARGWVAVEQPGPWGRDAAAQSHLDSALGQAVSDRVKVAGGRFVLVRSTGQHADDHHERPRTVLVSSCVPGSQWLLSGTVTDLHDLLTLDVAAVVRGELEPTLASMPGLALTSTPMFLVCTNGRRDVCCAVRGRPVARDAAAARPGQVWETSHTGGHRFAPTGVVLPSGVTLARVSARDVVAALDAALDGALPAHLSGPRHDRGCSALSSAEQAAESAVRHLSGEIRLSALRVGDVVHSDDTSRVTVHRVGSSGETTATTVVSVRRTTRAPARPSSCGKQPELQQVYDVEVLDTDVDELTAEPRRA